MVTTERPIPSADGAPPPTIAWAGAQTSIASTEIIRNRIFMRAEIAREHTHRQGAIETGPHESAVLAVSSDRRSHLAGMMLEAVIWDFGGVLTTSPFEAFSRFEIERGLPADIIRRTNASNHWENAWAKFERAEVDIETFDQLFAAESLALGAEVRGKDVLPLLSGDLRPEMIEALRRIKQQLKTGCITNNLPANAIGSAGGRSLYIAEVMALFDHVIESAKIGLRKPDPRIYQMMVETLGVDPKNCVYLDDLGVNLKPARQMGMTTIKVLNAPQAIAELETATGLSLR